MRKDTASNPVREWSAWAAGALTLAVALAAGCTTNRMPGNGQPATSPGIGTAGTASTPGSSSGTSGTVPSNPPMISSSADAAATMAAIQPHVGRVLGPADPGQSTAAAAQPAPVTGQY